MMAGASSAATTLAKATVVKKNAKAMKPSGIEWLGDIPEGWKVRRLRYLAEITTGNKDTQDAQPDGKYPFYVRSPIVERSNEYTFEGPGIMMAGDGAGAGRIFHYADGKYAVHQRVYRIYDFKDTTACFLLYSHGAIFPSEMDKGSAQSTVPSVRLPMLRDLQIPLPPLPEQRAIADYLDAKYGAIDAAIAEAKKGIEEYKAWKKSLIFEAVTGKKRVGIFNAEKQSRGEAEKLKPSGIPWIGEIPDGWRVMKLRRLGTFANGISKGGEFFGTGDPFVCYSDVYKNEALPTTVKGLLLSTPEEQERYSVRTGDVFFTRTSETVDEIGFASTCLQSIAQATFAGFLIRFRPTGHEILPCFSKYYFRNKLVSEYFAKELVMVTRASLGQELLKSLPVLLPSLPEQQAIADYLDEKCAAIDAMVAEKEALIADLEAYKKSLIYEVVTGKRQVA